MQQKLQQTAPQTNQCDFPRLKCFKCYLCLAQRGTQKMHSKGHWISRPVTQLDNDNGDTGRSWYTQTTSHNSHQRRFRFKMYYQTNTESVSKCSSQLQSQFLCVLCWALSGKAHLLGAGLGLCVISPTFNSGFTEFVYAVRSGTTAPPPSLLSQSSSFGDDMQ